MRRQLLAKLFEVFEVYRDPDNSFDIRRGPRRSHHWDPHANIPKEARKVQVRLERHC